MFDIFKKIFRKTQGDATQVQSPDETTAEASAEAAGPEATSTPGTPMPGTSEAAGASGSLKLPIKSIIPRLSEQVRMKVNLVGASNATISIPVAKVLEQLPYGSVNISIDELKQLSPPQVFAHVDGQEQMMVELPLGEILSRLDPALLRRKSEQKQIEIPKTVTDLFSGKGEALPPPPPGPEEQGTPRLEAKRVAAPATPTAAHKPAIPPAPASSAKVSPSANLRDQALAAMAAAAKPPSAPATAKPPSAAATTPAVSVASPAALEGESVTVALSAVSAAWPEEVRQEMVAHNLSGTTLGLPAAKVGEGLRVGHVAFTWKEIRAWLNPAPTVAASPDTAETLLEIPLSVIAPVFLPKIKGAAPRKQAFVAEGIPDIFGRTGVPLPGVAAAPAETPMTAPAASAEAVPAPARLAMTEPTSAKEKAPSTLEDIIGKPAKKPSNPNEVVQRMVALPSVVGALVTLQEGLLVASHWAPGVKPDTLGAFVPQIFSRLNQYMREMQLGEVHNATFTLDKSTLHIFKSGNLYFAVLGRAGQPLPLPSILAIASELTSQHA